MNLPSLEKIEILLITYCNIDNPWVKEYEYKLHSNNHNLVQMNDGPPSSKSIIF